MQFRYAPREEKKYRDLAFFYFFFFLQYTKCDSVVYSDTRLHINPLHFLARSAVCSQMSCTSCLSNDDIQTPDQISVPCTTPCFHKDTLTPPSSSRSPPLVGGGPSMFRPAMPLYITHDLYFEIYSPSLEGIQLMSIVGYEAFVCVCFFMYKILYAALHMAAMGCPLSPVCVFILHEKII